MKPQDRPLHASVRLAPDRASRIRRAPTRQRILQAVTEVSAARGYRKLTVEQVIERAGVSRSTFYEHFSDRDECFLTALDGLSNALIERLESVEPNEAGGTPGPLIEVLCGYVSEDRDAARVLFSESLAAGAESLDRREELRRRTTILIAAASPRVSLEDEQAEVVLDDLVGGLFRLFAMRLRHGRSREGEFRPADLAAWVDSYSSVLARPSRRRLAATTRKGLKPTEPFELRPLSAGRHHFSDAEVAMNQRLRIFAATVRLSYESGYSSVTVAEITAAARVSRNAFYQQFRDKSEAATRALDLILEQVIGSSAGAFCSASQWPERVWKAARAFGLIFAAAPDYAHVGLVETHAIGDEAVQLVYDRIGAFMLFLEEGYRRRAPERELPRVSSEAIGAAMFEIAFRALRERRQPEWYSALLPQFVFICLAPFMGPEQALDFAHEKAQDIA